MTAISDQIYDKDYRFVQSLLPSPTPSQSLTQVTSGLGTAQSGRGCRNGPLPPLFSPLRKTLLKRRQKSSPSRSGSLAATPPRRRDAKGPESDLSEERYTRERKSGCTARRLGRTCYGVLKAYYRVLLLALLFVFLRQSAFFSRRGEWALRGGTLK